MAVDNFLGILGAVIVAVVVVGGIIVVVRNLWLTATDPSVAYLPGRKTRKAVEGAAHTVGQVAGAADEAAGVVGRSFREGRDSVKNEGGAQGGDG